MAPISKQAKSLAAKTDDAYSFDRYVSWPACAQLLLHRGYTERAAEAILRSKWMRWAGDAAEKTAYGHHTSGDLARYLDDPRNNVNAQAVAELVAGTFND